MDANIIINSLGGTKAVARACRVKPPSVSGWRKNGIPSYRLDFLRLKFPKQFRSLKKQFKNIATESTD
jgi:hypothetical protein